MPTHVTINESEYEIGLMDPRTAFHVARRLAPLLDGVAPVLQMLNEHGALAAGAAGGESGSAPPIDPMGLAEKALPFFTKALSGMDDAAANFIFDRCLATVKRKNNAGRWVPMVVGGACPFEQDNRLAVQLEIVCRVIVENLGDFLSVLLGRAQTLGVQAGLASLKPPTDSTGSTTQSTAAGSSSTG